jgi:hypothetical protein
MYERPMRSLLLALLLASSPAYALSGPKNGPTIELAGGGGIGGAEPGVHSQFAAHGSFGWWFGPYDNAYSLGRYWAVHGVFRNDWTRVKEGYVPSYSGTLEVRRGVDLFVVKIHGFLGAGLQVARGGLGPTVRAGVGAKYKPDRFWGVMLRLEGGASYVGGKVHPVGTVLVGVEFSRPTAKPGYEH